MRMFRHTARRLAVAAVKAAEPSSYTLAVSGAQGVARGLTGGSSSALLLLVSVLKLTEFRI